MRQPTDSEWDMRDGYRVVDIDTHVLPSMELLHEHGSETLRDRWPELQPYLRPTEPRPGLGDLDEPYHSLSVSPIPYERTLGHKGAVELPQAGGRGALDGKTQTRIKQDPQVGVQHANSAGRLHDMDIEGVDRDVI